MRFVDVPNRLDLASRRLWSVARGCLMTRAVRPFALIGVGSSTMFGTGSTSNANRFWNRVIVGLQTAYPSGLGSETTVASLNTGSGAPFTSAGVHGYDGGIGGATSANYLGSTQLAQIAQVAAVCQYGVVHAIFSNDFRTNVSPATAKANLQTVLTSLKQATNPPKFQVLLHIHEAYDGTFTYPWSAYGKALQELADADPTGVFLVEVTSDFQAVGIPPNGALSDTFGMMASDLIHLNDVGHNFLADLILEGMGALHPASNPATTPDTAPPSVPGTPTATAGAGSASVAFALSTDNRAVTGYNVYSSADNYASVVKTGTGSPIVVSGLPVSPVSFKVAAYDAVPNTSAQSAASNSVTPTASAGDTTAPTPPTTVKVEPGTSSTAIALSWLGASDDVAVTGYKVYRDGTLITSTALGNVLSYSDTTAVAGTRYGYQVTALDAAGNESAKSTIRYGMTGTVRQTFNQSDGAIPATADSGQTVNTRLSTGLRPVISGLAARQTQPYTADTGVTSRAMASTDVGTGSAAITFGFHVAATAVAADASGGFAFNIASTGNSFTYLSFRQSGTALGLSIVKVTSAGGAPSVVQTGTVVLQPGDFVDATFSGTTLTAYVNGAQAVTSASVSTKTTSEVGVYTSGAWNAAIDDYCAA